MNTTTGRLKDGVADIMATALIKVEMQDSMHAVAEVLHAHHLSSVPVVDPVTNECFGIISLKDIHHLNAQKTNLKAIRAWEACTYKPIAVAPDVSIEDVGRLMIDHRIHHVIIAENRKLKGFVSSLDIIAACVGSSMR